MKHRASPGLGGCLIKLAQDIPFGCRLFNFGYLGNPEACCFFPQRRFVYLVFASNSFDDGTENSRPVLK